MSRERAQIIDPVQVVGMRVCKKHRVDPIDICREELQSQLRWSVDQQLAISGFENHSMASPLIARIRRAAYIASTPDHGYAERSSSAEEAKLHTRPQSVSIRM
jgi:hypothetical protein